MALLCLKGGLALAEPAPRTLDQALTEILALGDAAGCGTPFGIPAFATQQETDELLRNLRDTGQLGRELTAVCGTSAVNSAAATGGSMGSPQATKTVSQFRLVRQRIDTRLDVAGKRFGLGGSLLFAESAEPSRPTLMDVTGPDLAPKAGFGTFVQAEYERRERATTPLETGYDANVAGGLIGFDYATPGGFLAGVWAGYGSTSATYARPALLIGSNFGVNTSGLSTSLDPALISDICHVSPGGGFDDQGFKVGGFVGARFGAAFADLALQYSRRDYGYRRNICTIEPADGSSPIVRDPGSPSGFSSNGIAIDDIYAGTISGKTKLTEWSISARAGYDFGGDRFFWGPRASITYVRSRIDPFTETGRTSVTNPVTSNTFNAQTGEGLFTTRAPGDPTGLELAYDAQTRTSLQTETQLVAAYRFEGEFGAIIPRVSAGWIHEFEGDRNRVTVRMAQDLRPTPARFSFTTDSADKDKAVVTVGVAALLGPHFAADLEVARLLGDAKFESTSVTVQARWRF